MPKLLHSHSAGWVRLPVLLAGVSATVALAAAPVKKALAPTGKKPPAPNTQHPTPNASPTVRLAGPWQKSYRLKAGETVEVSVRLEQPSTLPANGRVGVEWTLERPDNAADVVPTPEKGRRAVDALEIPAAPTANWRKVLHALDADVYVVYRAPVAGTYRLALAPVTDETPVGNRSPRWREKGEAPEVFPLPEHTPWPGGTMAPVTVSVDPVHVGTPEQVEQLGTMIETEPNDTPEQAQPLTLVPNEDVRTYEITGSADDVEYFDNGLVGRSGDDWYRVELKASGPRLLTAQLSMPNQAVAARIRTYALEDGASPVVKLGDLLPVKEWNGKVNPDRVYYNENKPVQVEEGRDPNERAHQQDEQHRTNITRLLEPGKTYYLRVEANAPGYQLQLRVLQPAPYTNPAMAVRQAMYTQIGQVDAWLTNRPRGASVERRIRDSGNLLGTQCMSCHTQSGVWGPAWPIGYGYRVENVQNEWHLLNVMYECLRPTNELKDAANNTSLAPLDVGDGPAGTRAAGFNIVNAERVFPPKKLHAKQQLRTANFVLQTNDPGGINAAGPGSNYGQAIVWLFAGEILSTAWKKTGEPKYFRLLEEKARRMLALEPKWTDDVAVRLDFFGRVLPMADYPAESQKAADAEKAAGSTPKADPADAGHFVERVKAQLAIDETRLRAIQNEDGTWGFNPGTPADGGKTWKAAGTDFDPAPTALAITGLNSIGAGKDDPAVAKGVQALLRMQEPSGRWNKAAITGFVTSAYAMRALARLYPVANNVSHRSAFKAPADEPLLAAVRRVQRMALSGRTDLSDHLLEAARHPATLVRYWAMIGLGAVHDEAGVPVLLAALREKAKPVREAATWALRQTLLDDHGWTAVLNAYDRGDDTTRAQIAQALVMRADAVMPQAHLDWSRLTRTLAHAMNEDAHPAVRAWAAKAAWQWWVWNPPARKPVNEAWVAMLTRPETDALVENSNRYSSQALFIVNGHKANGSNEHQYKELAELFELLRKRLEAADPTTKSLLARRMTAVAATFYTASGFDGGPGQLGYTTPNAGATVGQSVVVYLREIGASGTLPALRLGVEGAANVPHGPLQEQLLDLALKGPEELRKEAAAAVSDPRSAMLTAAIEQVEPLVTQVKRGAADPPRRPAISDPVLKLFATVNWVLPKDAEQQRLFFDLMVPKLDRYVAPAELAAMTDAAERGRLEREMDAAWYLADRMGDVLATNPDLHQDMVLRRYFPEEFRNPLERQFWIRSVPWILDHENPLPQLKPDSVERAEGGDADLTAIKARALKLYLDALTPEAPAETRAAAVRVANRTALRTRPEVVAALEGLQKWEKDGELKQIARNVAAQQPERFMETLTAALQSSPRLNRWLGADGKPKPQFLADFTYFRDYVTPELAGIKRTDSMACVSCHGVKGRVPSFYLEPVDNWGYQPVDAMLKNYRELQARVNLKEPARSKILRKPLNVQDGTEDGHQGGRRYTPQDAGYQILKQWVENQPKLQETVESP